MLQVRIPPGLLKKEMKMARRLIKDVREEERSNTRHVRKMLTERIWKLQFKLGMAKEEIKALKVALKDLKRENKELVEYADLFSNCHCDENGECEYMTDDE